LSACQQRAAYSKLALNNDDDDDDDDDNSNNNNIIIIIILANIQEPITAKI
jgi:hypothetical protein